MHDGFAGSRPYDEYTALPGDGEDSDVSVSGVQGGAEVRDRGGTVAEDCEWAALIGASRIERVRWLHGGVLHPSEIKHAALREDDSFSDHVAKYADSEDRAYAQSLVTDFNDVPWRPPWWLKKDKLFGDDDIDRTDFQSIIHNDDYLEQPEELKP